MNSQHYRINTLLLSSLGLLGGLISGLSAAAAEIYIPPMAEFTKCRKEEVISGEICMMPLDLINSYAGEMREEHRGKVTFLYLLARVGRLGENKEPLVEKIIYHEAWDCIDSEIVSRAIYGKTLDSTGKVVNETDLSWWRRGRGYLVPYADYPESWINKAKGSCLYYGM